jgi:hypothetical protein
MGFSKGVAGAPIGAGCGGGGGNCSPSASTISILAFLISSDVILMPDFWSMAIAIGLVKSSPLKL